jgi:hypothetical protein
LTLYGGANLGLGIAAVVGIIEGPAERDAAFWGYLLVWAPWWTVIGLSFLVLSVIVSGASIRGSRHYQGGVR